MSLSSHKELVAPGADLLKVSDVADFPPSYKSYNTAFPDQPEADVTRFAAHRSIIDSEGMVTGGLKRAEWDAHMRGLSKSGVLTSQPHTRALPLVNGISIHTIIDGGISLRVLCPSSLPAHETSTAPTTVFLYFHGGGAAFGSGESGDSILSRVVSALGIPAVSVVYRLAPEHRFPAAHDDGLIAYSSVLKSKALTDILGRSVSGIVVGGLSSGGGLALSLAHAIVADERTRASLKGIVVCVPDTDVTAGDPANERPIQPFVSWFIHNYARNISDCNDPRWSVTLAPISVLAKLPSLTIFTAQYDDGSEDALTYAAKVEKAGGSSGKVILGRYERMHHDAQGWDAVCQEAREGNVELIRSIGRAAGIPWDILQRIGVDELYPDPLWEPVVDTEVVRGTVE